VQATISAALGASENSTEALLGAMFELFRASRRFTDTTALALPHYSVLRLLHLRHTDARLTEIADALGYDMSVLSRHITIMIDQGLITRLPDPNDGRAWQLHLTETGEARLHAAAERWLGAMHGWLQEFSDADQRLCTSLIGALSQGITSMAPQTRLDN